MAAKMVSAGKQSYIGLSQEDRPGTPPEGSDIHFLDTGEVYIFHDGMWEQDLRLINALKSVL